MNARMIGLLLNVNILPHPTMLVEPNLANLCSNVRVHVEVADRGLVNVWRSVDIPHGARTVPGGRTTLKEARLFYRSE